MAIRPVVNGKTCGISAARASPDGTTRLVTKVYMEKNGKTKLCWRSPEIKNRRYTISSVDDLKKIADDPGGFYLITADLTFDEEHKTEDYFPLLPPEVPFTGILDGQGYKLVAKHPNTFFHKVLFSSGEGIPQHFGTLFIENCGIITRINMREFDIYQTLKSGGSAAEGSSGVLVGVNKGIIDQTEANSRYTIDVNLPNHGGLVGENYGAMRYCKNVLANGDRHKNFKAGIAYKNMGRILSCGAFINKSYSETVTYPPAVGAYENCEGAELMITRYYYSFYGVGAPFCCINNGRISFTNSFNFNNTDRVVPSQAFNEIIY